MRVSSMHEVQRLHGGGRRQICVAGNLVVLRFHQLVKVLTEWVTPTAGVPGQGNVGPPASAPAGVQAGQREGAAGVRLHGAQPV